MLSLVYQGAKYSYFLVLVFALPLLLETRYVTQLWLGQIPDYSVLFIQLMLMHSLLESLSKTIIAGTLASGNIRMYQLVVGVIQIITLPIAYILLKLGYAPSAALIAVLVIDLIALLVRVIMARHIFSLSFVEFFKKVLLLSVLTTIVAIVLPLTCKLLIEECLHRFLIVVLLCVVTVSFSVLYVGCTSSERSTIMNKAIQILNRIKKK